MVNLRSWLYGLGYDRVLQWSISFLQTYHLHYLNGRRKTDLPRRAEHYISWVVAITTIFVSAGTIASSFHADTVYAGGTNTVASPDSIRYLNSVSEFNATTDSGASSDITTKMTNNVLIGAGATEDLQDTSGNDRFLTVYKGINPATYGNVILRLYIASIDQPLRIKVYPYSSSDLANISPVSGDAYPIAPNILTSNDVTKPTISSNTSADAGWININVSHIAHYMDGGLDLKLRIGLESPDGSSVKASISEVMLNLLSNSAPHDNYIMLSTEWCGQCHSRHNGGQKSLLRPPVEKAATPDIFTAGQQTKEESICYVCHDGTGSVKDIRTEFRKSEAAAGGAMRIWRYTGSHDRKEPTGSGDPNTYVADGENGLQIINVSNPTSPMITASVDTPGTAEDVFVWDNHAFIADGAEGLQIIDVTDPLSARIVGSLDAIASSGYCGGVYVSSKDAYVSCGQAGVKIVNISNKYAPTLESTIAVTSAEAVMVTGGVRPYTINSGYGAPSTYTASTEAIIAANTNGVYKYDVSNPASPVLKGSYNTAGEAKDIFIGDFISGPRAYVADGSNGLVILDIVANAPCLKNQYNTAGNAEGVYVVQDRIKNNGSNDANAPVAYVADGTNGLVLINTSQGTTGGCSVVGSLSQYGSYDTAGYASEVNVVNNYAYVADDTTGLNIIRVDGYSSGSLILVGSADTAGSARGVSPTYSVHVECFDCHNPHLATYKDRFRGKRGISASGEAVGWGTSRQRLNEYEICFQCHGSTVRQAVGRVVEDIPSTFPYSDKQREFNPANSAYHPVVAPGRNKSIALNRQLQKATENEKVKLSTADTILCSDCHNSDMTENTYGPVANYSIVTNALGLHGSKYTTNKRAFYFNNYYGPSSYSDYNFKLCFRCHYEPCFSGQYGTIDGNPRLLGGATDCTNFCCYNTGSWNQNLHQKHLVEGVGARITCKNCHYNLHSNIDAPNTEYRYGALAYYRPPGNYPTRLVNFSPELFPSNAFFRRPRWGPTSSGYNTTRFCYVACHTRADSPIGAVGATMNGYDYRPNSCCDVPVN